MGDGWRQGGWLDDRRSGEVVIENGFPIRFEYRLCSHSFLNYSYRKAEFPRCYSFFKSCGSKKDVVGSNPVVLEF